ncbi:terpenoid cyclases/Protein prenyltransferase [Dendrothele bispora CBS 962.96]|uniref:Protein farnesyltransferase subunit beta n=1 Tax=Dendrothele bispora (strain CBS 962.96) TaxID=1314807 RepID=A0A4S8MZP6_DENBC|nr:terpenoid cyclases/Protein prenyltransferase [Dendrothele bispora CBS 962.96]
MAAPTPVDSYPTPTSKSQSETEEILLAHLPTAHDPPTPQLQKNSHLQFVARNLIQGFPARYTSQDASQPWLLFWTLQALSMLQVVLDPNNKQRVIDTLLTFQHPEGGFGGGPGQMPHLLPTYAAICALAIVGKPGERGGWDAIDRSKLYNFFMSLKQPDGSFTVSRNGEVDVRGIYCLLCVATLLNIITPELVEGTPEFLASCQTYEGGFASASFPYFVPDPSNPSSDPKLLSSPRPPLGEAHGGYTFCAVASWVLLKPFIERSPSKTSINTRLLTRWLVQMQGMSIELGGFKGRTNKLVDGCYAWWIGGCFALLKELGEERATDDEDEHEAGANADEDDTDGWVDDEEIEIDDVWNPIALQEYILYAGQHPAGGLRDKPPKGADAYHTLYCLAGLSAAQHRMNPDRTRRRVLEALWNENSKEGESENWWAKDVYTRFMSWSEAARKKRTLIGGEGNRINATHPIFNLTATHTESIMAHFYRQPTPPKRQQ